MLQDTVPGTEMHKNSFGQDREGESIIVQWQSKRRFVAELQAWNPEEDNFTLTYPEQENSAELKTSKSDMHSQGFRLDTLETDWLMDPEVGAASGKLYHSWWISMEHVNLPFISKKLLVDMDLRPRHKKPRPLRLALSSSDETDDESDDDEETDDEVPLRKLMTKPKRGRITRQTRQTRHVRR